MKKHNHAFAIAYVCSVFLIFNKKALDFAWRIFSPSRNCTFSFHKVLKHIKFPNLYRSWAWYSSYVQFKGCTEYKFKLSIVIISEWTPRRRLLLTYHNFS